MVWSFSVLWGSEALKVDDRTQESERGPCITKDIVSIEASFYDFHFVMNLELLQGSFGLVNLSHQSALTQQKLPYSHGGKISYFR
jgi:hypothetical protein